MMNAKRSVDWLAARARTTPQNTAVIVGDQTYSYSQLDRLVDELCQELVALGIEPGSRVATLLPANLAHVALVHALARLGAVLVPLNTRLTASEVGWQLEHAAVRLLICASETEVLAAADVPQDCAAYHLRFDQTGSAGWFVGTALAGSRLKDRLKPPLRTRRPTLQTQSFDLGRLQAIIFTSGTTGRPKGTMLSFANHFWSATASAFHLGTRAGDRWLSCLPLCHVGGLAILFRCCLYGSAVVLHNGFDGAAVLRSLESDKPTIISLVPTMLYRLLEAGIGETNLRLALLGGAAAYPDLVQRALDAGLPIAPTYGLTEAASQVATQPPAETACKPGSVGKPLLFTTVSIWDEEGPVMAGTPGEIVVNGPSVMSGYFNDNEATANTLRPEGLRTGDIGFLDQDGDLWLVDRRVDLIVSGGENVYPAEVERVLLQHPGVAAACVVGIPHPEWGQQVTALVVPSQPEALSAADLLNFSRPRLAGYKQPRRVEFASQLPLTGSGKIHRREVTRLLSNETMNNETMNNETMNDENG
jgi:O-succinylbenzoic acid--CoA ligase